MKNQTMSELLERHKAERKAFLKVKKEQEIKIRAKAIENLSQLLKLDDFQRDFVSLLEKHALNSKKTEHLKKYLSEYLSPKVIKVKTKKEKE